MISNQQLFIFGDSISCGVMYDESAGRYTLCRNTYDRVLRRQDVPVKNYAKPGCTAADAVRDLEKTEPLAGAQCIIEFGGNDSDLNWEDVSRQPDIAHKAKVSLADFRASLLRLIDYARANAMQPIIALPLPVVADRYFEWVSRSLDRNAILRYLGSTEYIYRWQERYAYQALKTASEAHCPVLDLRGAFLDQRDFRDMMSLDGIHPNESGYGLIREAALQYLQ